MPIIVATTNEERIKPLHNHTYVGPERFRTCYSRLAILRWIEIAFCCVILGLICEGCYGWNGYPYIIAISAFCLAITFFILCLIFIGYHPSINSDFIFNILACLMFAAAFAIAVYDTTRLFDRNYDHHRDSGRGWYPSGMEANWRNRMAAVAAFCAANGILYAITALYVKRFGIL